MHSFLLAALLITAAAAPPRPLFSWSNVPTFQHLASVNATPTAPFPPARLAWLAATFPVVVLEHAHAMGAWAYTDSPSGGAWGPEPFAPPGGYIEDAFQYTAAALKARNASTTVIYYQQITGALPYYRASRAAADHALVLDAGTCAPLAAGPGAPRPLNDILPNYVTYAWNHLVSAVTDNFIAAFKNMTAPGSALDGTFIDTASCYSANGQADASLATVQAMQAAVPDKIVGFHTSSALAGANGFSMAMDYTFASPKVKAPGKGTSCDAGVAWLDANAVAGVLSFAHIGDVDQGPDMIYSLACFLAGANDASYFAFSSANKTEELWRECWDGGSPTAPVFPTWCSGQGWSADYARPLGPPTGPRTPTGGGKGEVTRSFASGTKVTIELNGPKCEIAWADGHMTTC